MSDPLLRLKIAFSFPFLRALRDAIIARPKIKFGSGFVITESDGEILVDIAGKDKPGGN
ncbi:MAG TPA: hypothetical protein PLU30_17440 [Verrucomicrobiae bacterium]|nr:hypothetical protein [Verrucomicrobiae bacterium]